MDKNVQLQVTVVICPRNHTGEMRSCIDSLMTQTLPREHYAVLIVDNSSSDNTENLAKSLAGAPVSVTRIYEPRPGLANARNTGLAHARTPYIAYIGETAIAQPDWLETLVRPFALDDRPAAVGGELAPLWGVDRPAWLTDRWLKSYSASLSWSATARFLKDDEWLCDSNICFDTQLLRQAGGFSIRLGGKGDDLPASNQFVEQHLQATGARFYFEPRAIVDQTITTEHLTPKWLGKQQFWQGVADAVLEEEAARLTQTASGWTEMRLPVSHWEWSALVNLYPDSGFDKALEHSRQLGYVLQKGGLIG
jgi:hypothetical protein